MKLQYLGTAAAEGIPALFCECENCKKARALGGRNIRSRSQALIDDKILIDFPADTYMHFINHRIPLSKIATCLVTHSHADHLYPADIQMRISGNFAHPGPDAKPLTFYGDRSSYGMIQETIERAYISAKDVGNVLVELNQTFEVEGYQVTAIRANHDPGSTPVLYVIEKDGKSIFYSNDTGEYPEESWEVLRTFAKSGKKLSLVSFDCTSANSVSDYYGHFDFMRCIRTRQQMMEEGIVDESTKFVLNHFSHNGDQVVYDEFVPIAAAQGFEVSYDGMIVEIV